ncbi:exported hypothetical protein [Candidatus Sulfotelmatomonas gaucii]|uniref:Uncharacterized protein n=1 Tax=Candidatus Sulfuritelmatomonas gaucii TaxID=2043161 RepID=A0A2N9L448_9BACT|nr:exported hypothetical protein [Candidatus Sulfotelmatomonas gaucii]
MLGTTRGPAALADATGPAAPVFAETSLPHFTQKRSLPSSWLPQLLQNAIRPHLAC